MRHYRSHAFRLVLMGLIAICVVIIGISSSSRNSARSAAISTMPPNPDRYVYFELADISPARKLHLVASLGQPEQVIIVSTAAQLQATVAAHHPPAIWIHADARNLVPQAWLRDQVTQGTVVVGIDMTERELADLLGLDPLTYGSTWRPNDGRPSYVAYYETQADIPQPNGRVSHVSGRGTLNNPFDPNNPAEIFAATAVTIQKVKAIGLAVIPSPVPNPGR